MLRLLPCLLVFGLLTASLPTHLFAEEEGRIPNTDSLLQVVNEGKTVEAQVEACYELSRIYYFSDLEKSAEYNKKGLELAQKADFKEGIGRGYARISNSISNQGNLDSAITLMTLARDIYAEIGSDPLLSDAYYDLGKFLVYKGDFPGALAYGDSAMVYANGKRDSSLIYELKGAVHYYSYDFDSALIYFLESAYLREEIGDSAATANSLMNIGSLYCETDRYELCAYYSYLGIQYLKNMGRERDASSAYNTLGVAFEALERQDSAIWAFRKSYEVSKEFNDSASIAVALHNWGGLLLTQKRPEEAKEKLQEAYAIRNLLGRKSAMASSAGYLARYYSQIGDTRTAIRYYEESIELADSVNAMQELYESNKFLARSYAEIGSFEKAYYSLERARKIGDTLSSRRAGKELIKVQEEFESREKQKKIELLNKENELQELRFNRSRNLAISLGAVALAILFSLVMLISRFRLVQKSRNLLQENNRLLEEQKRDLELEKENMELKALLVQMNPHFLFNSLYSIQRFIATNEQEAAHQYLSKFARLMRMTLQHSERQNVPLADELQAISLYLELESLRVDHKFDFVLDIDPAIDVNNVQIPPMMLQPYLENAIWHGLMAKTDGKGLLKLVLKDGEDRIHTLIEDNGIGRKRSEELKSKDDKGHVSAGMRITSKRFSQIWAKRGEKLSVAVIDLEDKEGVAQGTRIEMDLPAEF